jgi:hypothetical protein
MITIGFSTRNDNPEFIKYLKQTCGIKDVEVIQKINNGEKSLSVVYNEIIKESTNDILVICHDDVLFDTKNWGKNLLKNFEKSEYGIIGLAGSVYLHETGRWWEKAMTMRGIVNHQHDGKKWESRYSINNGKISEVLLIDGLFISFDKTKIKNQFDETINGFHFYDVAFSFSNHLEGVKIGVTYDVRVTHLSIGQTNDQWEKNRILFSEKYKDNLPTKLDVKSDLTTFIVCHDENIIKNNIINEKYKSLGDVVFMYVGNKDFTDIDQYENVIIVKDLKFNIEQYPNFTAFTAWYAIWKNNLCHTKYMNLLEYDTNITENYAYYLKNILVSNPKIISYFPLTMRNNQYILNENWVKSIFNGIKKVYKIDMSVYMTNVINNALSQGQEPIWSTTNNICIDKSIFDKYMKWIGPLLTYMKEDQYAGHNQERALSFFSVLNKVPIGYFTDEIEHVQADSHKTQGHNVTKQLT